jgi:hypothetical protein
MAALHARGLTHAGETMSHASVLGSSFDGRIVSETDVAGRPAIVPTIRGSAWITGVTEMLVDPTDPFPEGYLLSDTWPGNAPSDAAELKAQKSWSRPLVTPTRSGTARIASRVPATYGAGVEPASWRIESRSSSPRKRSAWRR